MFFQNRFTDKAQSAIKRAYEAAGELGHSYVGSEHLLLGLIREMDGISGKAMADAGISEEKIMNSIVASVGRGTPGEGAPQGLTPRVKRIIECAAAEAVRLGHGYVGTEHLMMGMIREGENVSVRLMAASGVDPSRLYMQLARLIGGGSAQAPAGAQQPRAETRRESRSEAKVLAQFGRDLTELARNGKLDPVIGRDREIDRVMQILSRRQKNNPALIGEPGVGKTAIAEGLAQRITAGDVPSSLAGKRLISLDLSGMIAGTKYRGEFEERIKTAIEEVIKSGDIILFVDEMHTLIGAGAAEGSIDAANILKPALSRGDLQVIGATTLDEYRKHIEKDAALERRFQSVMVGEPNEEDAVLILKGLRDRYEAHHGVKITDDAITAAVKLSVRYIGDRYLPDKAIDLIDEAASALRMKALTPPPDLKEIEMRIEKISKEKEEAVCGQDFEKAAGLRDEEKNLKDKLENAKLKWQGKSAGGPGSGEVTEADIAAVVSEWTGVPVTQLTETETERLLHMEDILHIRLVGQDQAVHAVSKAIRRGRVGLKDPKRPIGSFIFLGPTGVGKTELSKALAEAVFGDEKAMIRVDMSEYMEKHTVSKLIGSPPGYVGYDEGGQLTEKIRRKPYSVILFDEIEKAHPDVFNVLLQILEDGHLTDAQGRRVDFKNAVIIMTSNIGARYLTGEHRSLGFAAGEQDSLAFDGPKNQVLAELKKSFRPEFLNRVDDIIVFNRLNKSEIKQITGKLLSAVAARVAGLGITLTWDESVETHLAEAGFDESYGARPLRRAVQSQVEDAIAERILDGRIRAGQSISLSLSEGALAFGQSHEPQEVHVPV